MIRLLSIEFRKHITSSGFWILVALHVVVLFIATRNFSLLLENANIVINNQQLPTDFSLEPILQFPDLWQNLAYIAGYFKLILALIIVSSVCNEFSYKTARQNIIDGMNRSQWIMSKALLGVTLAFFSMLLVIALGLSIGYTHEELPVFHDVMAKADFVGAYFIELVVYFIYALFLSVVFRRTGITIILLLAYDFILEPALSWSLPGEAGSYLPMNVIDNLIQFPFAKYVNVPVQESVEATQWLSALAYGVIFALFSYMIFNRRDL